MITGLIQREIPDYREALQDYESYSFSNALSLRMEQLFLSSAALGERLGLSHTVIDNWRNEKAVPNSRESVKTLGLALEYNERELHLFLLRNGYPGLSPKNPLDSAVIHLLNTAGVRRDLAELYDSLIEKLNLARFAPSANVESLRSSMIADGLMRQEEWMLSGWFAQHKNEFTAGAKTMRPVKGITDYLRLYMLGDNVNCYAEEHELPPTLVNLLYEIFKGKAVSVRGLREKLIGLGLFFNMTEEEIDILLSYFKLCPVSEPLTRTDAALLVATREGHMRYALYESENMDAALTYMKEDGGYGKGILLEYTLRSKRARERADYYLKTKRSAEEQEFEENYTSYSDRGLADYARDVLTALVECGELKEKETNRLLDSITRQEADEK